MKKINIFSRIPENIPNEIIETIINSGKIKIERIISKGHSTPKSKWYNQDKDEFVIILKGNAKLEFKNNEIISMEKGDYINIPTHIEHRVSKTNSEEETIWLAVHY